MGKLSSFRSKAFNIVSDFATFLLNTVSHKASKKPPFVSDNQADLEKSLIDSECEEGSLILVKGSDTTSFASFPYSVLKEDYFKVENGQFNEALVTAENEPESKNVIEVGAVIKTDESIKKPANVNVIKESGGKRGLFSRGRRSIGKAMRYAARLAGLRKQAERQQNSEVKSDEVKGGKDGGSLRLMGSTDEVLSSGETVDMSENSLLLSQKTQIVLYASFPALVKGRKWVLLYSTWRDGISLGTLYRKSMLCPGLSLLVVGDRGGGVFGGLVEAPLTPSTSRKYQGSNSTILFTDALGHPVIYHPTGANRYYTLCSTDFLALGGGCGFALYLDSDLLNGSSAASDTYGNSCLALSEDFAVKGVELWGFVYGSKYEEVLALSRNELPGICRW